MAGADDPDDPDGGEAVSSTVPPSSCPAQPAVARASNRAHPAAAFRYALMCDTLPFSSSDE
ncbi:hypothetical protein GCM10010385_41400 [Streptomyces geysiriensis]|nr:hypothetical protein GCM10010385_41400 [Streptomyces geysiriensis]